VRALTNARQAAEQANKAIRDLDPMMALYAFVNMVQTVQALTSLMKALKASTAAASAAQAILTTLAGAWWLIPLAIAAGALVYSRIQSMQAGGIVKETGLYLLHKKEEVVPDHRVYSTTHYSSYARTVQSFGPIYVSFEKQPEEDERDAWMRGLEERLAQKIRRGG
jgi:heme/copper-type cytochrome/quinol oxidase subunit 2